MKRSDHLQDMEGGMDEAWSQEIAARNRIDFNSCCQSTSEAQW